jgi:hypothetical protein
MRLCVSRTFVFQSKTPMAGMDYSRSRSQGCLLFVAIASTFF